jgi:single-stranded-DNA-specific exonuclease
VSWANWKQIEKFAPFGMANPKPVFLFEKVTLADARYFGKEKTHLELSFEGSNIKAILFFAKTKGEENAKHDGLKAGDIINLVATMEVNTFRNARELRLRIVSVLK